MIFLKRVFGLDLRSIAIFRILLGLLLLADLLLRASDMTAFYTDQGVLPRHLWMQLANHWHWSLHAASGEFWWQCLLFCVAAVFALALVIGYRTRVAAIVSFILLASLLNRNTLVLQGGDQLLVIMSFWAMFLPLAARFSVDAALQPALKDNPNLVSDRASEPGTANNGGSVAGSSSSEHTYFSIATIAIVFQILYLYIFTAFLKTGAAWVSNFDAAFYAVSIQHFATPIGQWMSQFPQLLKVATFYVLSVEFIGPLLVLCPFFWPWFRLAGLVLLASLHAAFILMLHIGLFPLIDFMALSLLIPGALWVRAHHSAAWQERYQFQKGITLYYDEDCGFCLKMCLILRTFLLPSEAKILPAQQHPTIYPILERENSWVITDADGEVYVHWHAMAFLFSQRWIFKPIGWLMKLPPLLSIGNKVYNWVANHRAFMGTVTERVLPYRSLQLRPTLAGSALAALFFYIVTSFNVHGLPKVTGATPTHVDALARTTRLEQRWDMFAPYPLTNSSYVLMPGKLRNGELVELNPMTSSDPEWVPPKRFYPLYDGYRWRKYLGRVDGHRNKEVQGALGSYLCKTWNLQPRERETQLATLEIFYVKLQTNTRGEPKKETRYRMWRHWCFAEFADT